MKSFAIAVSLLLTGLATPPAHAQAQTPARLVPHGLHLFGRPVVRPLTRYLVATLCLTPKQAAAVQRVLHAHAAKGITPEQLSLSLNPVLSPEAQLQLLDIQGDAASYQTLTYLTIHH